MTAPAQRSTGLRLVTSNRLEDLAAQLANDARVPLSSPFRPEVVLVQSQGMARWLQFELARRLGVCAHVRFPFPKSFAWELFRAADDSLPAQPDSEPVVLAWRLMGFLPATARQPGFEAVASYLADDPEGRKRFQLAGRIAHLFDQYLIYRPEMILRWEQEAGSRGPQPASGAEGDWQATLWRELAKASRTPHPARLRETFAAALRDGTLPAGKIPERLSIFGISALPPFYVELFEALARHIPVTMFLLQPTREYWGDLDSARSAMRGLRRAGTPTAPPSQLHFHAGNRLLASLGNQGRDFLNVLLDATEFDAQDFSAAPDEDSLLHCVQSDIFQLRDRGAALEGKANGGGKFQVRATDDSIQVHSCHSPLRELEVLRDQMLSWFERDTSLAPQDILVMMPDTEAYAPFVEAVFGTAERDRRFIPFSIADRGASTSSPLLSSFLALLNLAGGRLGAASVLALLEAQPVRARFGLAESDLPLLRGWVDEAAIRWGRDAAHRARLDLPALPGNTWRQGLDRLLLGYALPGNGAQLFEQILPCDSSRHGETLGRFVAFVEALFDAVAQLEASCPLTAWVELLRRIAQTFFLDNDATEAESRLLLATLNDLEKSAQLAAFHEPIPLAVLLEHLAPALAEDHLQSGFITGRVTFGALKPMRSIPFKIICLAGMNDGAFPRSDTRTSFDLMAQSPRLGDRSRREDDRYLFLETLLSARQKLYISYVGQSARDNSSAPPSVLVSELLDDIEHGYALELDPGAGVSREDGDTKLVTPAAPASLRDHLVTRHRLQAFNEEYFRPGGRLFSYSEENAAACLALRGVVSAGPFVPRPLPPPDASHRIVRVGQLAEFFANPARYFVRERLQLRLPRPEAAIADREPIEIEALEAYDLKEAMLDRSIAGLDPGESRRLIEAAGRLPLGRVGDARHRELRDEVEAFQTRLKPFHPGERLEAVGVDFAIGAFRVTGELPAATPAGLLLFRPATIKPRDLVRAWVTHLAWRVAAAGSAGRTVLVGEETDGRSAIAFDAVPDAGAVLEGLLELYWRGLSEPLKFFPAASLAFAEEADPAAARDAARKAWTSDFRVRREDRDEYFALCFARIDPFDADFAAIAKSVFEPMLQYEEQLE